MKLRGGCQFLCGVRVLDWKAVGVPGRRLPSELAWNPPTRPGDVPLFNNGPRPKRTEADHFSFKLGFVQLPGRMRGFSWDIVDQLLFGTTTATS